MREKLRGQELSFTEIAKIVGECWQESSQSEKEPCEKEAQSLKEKYYANLAEYKKTLQYARYQEYVVEFRAKHNPGKCYVIPVVMRLLIRCSRWRKED